MWTRVPDEAVAYNPHPVNWKDDPELLGRERERSIRFGIVRSAILWSPFFLASFGALLFFLLDRLTGGDRATIFLLVVLSILSLLFGFQAIQSILDLFGAPETKTGRVTRRWAKRDSMVMKTHYVRVGRTILRADEDLVMGIKEGDEVEVRYYRHSGVLLACKRLKAAEVKPSSLRDALDRGR